MQVHNMLGRVNSYGDIKIALAHTFDSAIMFVHVYSLTCTMWLVDWQLLCEIRTHGIRLDEIGLYVGVVST